MIGVRVMKVVLCTAYGPPEVLKIGSLPKPVPNPDEVLVRIHATAVNSGDIRTRALDVKGPMKLAMRLVLGWGKPRNPVLGTVYAGVVEQAGASVRSFKAGDRVFGCTPGFKFGCYAEYIALKEDSAMTVMPEKASFDEAVSLLFGGTTALYFLQKAAPIYGQSILIYGASGSVGTSAVQVARNLGLVITAVSSGKNRDMVTLLGTDTFLDYTSPGFWDRPLQYDVVFDAVGKLSKAELRKLTREGGKTLTVGAMDVAKETKGQLEQLKAWYDSGKLKPVIDRTYPLEEIIEAHAYADQGHKVGNVVIEVV